MTEKDSFEIGSVATDGKVEYMPPLLQLVGKSTTELLAASQ